MHSDNAREYVPLVEALADGELQYLDGYEWQDADGVSFADPPSCYRRKPKPTVAPWTLETCPVGAVVRGKKTGFRSIIVAVTSDKIYLAQGCYTFVHIMDIFTMDNGAACGVVQS